MHTPGRLASAHYKLDIDRVSNFVMVLLQALMMGLIEIDNFVIDI
jgi:hypothetical protein